MKRAKLDTSALVDHLRTVHDQRLEHLRRECPDRLYYFAPHLAPAGFAAYAQAPCIFGSDGVQR